jgi:hypothetical protein
MIWTKASHTPFRRRIQFPPPTPQFLPAVMDNVPAHKADGVRQAIEAAGEDGLTVYGALESSSKKMALGADGLIGL